MRSKAQGILWRHVKSTFLLSSWNTQFAATPRVVQPFVSSYEQAPLYLERQLTQSIVTPALGFLQSMALAVPFS
jgi:hypothetical protein